MAEESRYMEAQSGWCAPPSGLVARGERGSIHYNSGGYVDGSGVPIQFEPSREQILTAKQASTRAREVLQAVRDATPDYTHFRYVGDTPDGTSLYEEDAPPRPNYCYYCHQPIRVMINRGTGWCSEQCRKQLAGGWDSDG